MVITTQNCARFRHPEFTLEADTSHIPEQYLQDTANIVEGMIAKGSIFRPGQTFQIGWMITQVQSHASGLLTLAEPDMRTFPVKWVPGITQTLRQTILQLFLLDSASFRKDVKMTTILQSAIVCSHYTARDFFMTRSDASNENDSGWFIGCLNRKHDHHAPSNLKRLSLYDVFLHQRAIHGFMSFPVGSMIILDKRRGMRIVRDGTEVPIEPGSLLDTWFKNQKKP
jgi:hypothetical protein